MACKLEPLVPSKPKSGSVVIPGCQFTFPDGIVNNKLQLEFILQQALQNVSNFGGKMVIAFPDGTPAKVKDYADQIKNTIPTKSSTKDHKQKQTRATTSRFSMFWPRCLQSAEPVPQQAGSPHLPQSDQSTAMQYKSYLQSAEPVPQQAGSPHLPRSDQSTPMKYKSTSDTPRGALIKLHSHAPCSSDYCVEVDPVGVIIIGPVEFGHVTTIYRAFTNNGHTPVIELVELHTSSYNEVLAVETDGQVIFASYPEAVNDANAIRFYKVLASLNHPIGDVIIWISLKTLTPIAIRSNHELYAEVPAAVPLSSNSSNGSSSTNTSPLYTWLSTILSQDQEDLETYQDLIFFCQLGTDNFQSVIHQASGSQDRRIIKNDNSAAIINEDPDPTMEFIVTLLYTYDIQVL